MANAGVTVADLLDGASRPEDVFGDDPDFARSEFRRLARLVHPDLSDLGAEAARLFVRLQRFWKEAETLIAVGAYGARTRSRTIRTRRDVLTVLDRFASGEACDVFYASSAARGTVDVVKVARRPADNDLVANEFTTVRRLTAALDDEWLKFLPTIHETFALRQSGGVVRRGNVSALLDGWYTLEDVRRRHPGGIDPRDMAWMNRRLLAILGAVHRAGIVHGAVLPPHVMIHPVMHGLVLLDWCYAVEDGSPLRAIERPYRSAYPREALGKEPVGPGTDVYLAAKTIGSLVDPGRLPKPLRTHFRAYELPDLDRRPDDAWWLHEAFTDVIERLWGPRRYRPFEM